VLGKWTSLEHSLQIDSNRLWRSSWCYPPVLYRWFTSCPVFGYL